ncbi:MAG: TRAP transporter large permease subunit, partial [Desulfobacterales bacterium]|nr:TRAP transporter large permease subunit [Desulfobacterales bacterium]
MEWWLIFLLIMISLLFLFAINVPVAFSFLFVNMAAAFFLWGGQKGLDQIILSIYGSVINFTMLPIPLFILMGEVMFRSGIAPKMIETIDKWLGSIPGRLSLMAVLSGTLFSTLSGSSMASTAMLGSVLVPEMEKRGYKKPMSIGPILGSGGLAIMIPPSALGVILASLARFSVGDLLIAIIIPGFIMAGLYMAYVIIRSFLQPHLAPAYVVAQIPLSEKIWDSIRYILPLGSIVFLVIGLIFLGVATPTESAALGALGCFVLAFLYRGLSWKVLKITFVGTIRTTVMIFVILSASVAFSQIMAYTGATNKLIAFITKLSLSPIMLVVAMQIVMLFMGTFLEAMPIMMITIPIFMPIIQALHINPIWFGVVMLLNMEMAMTSPPFGLSLFVMK